MKKIVLAVVLTFVLSIFCMAGESTMYAQMKNYKPGSFVKYNVAVKTGGVDVVTEMTYTLKEVKPNALVMGIKATTITMGTRVEAPEQVVEVPSSSGFNFPGMAGGIPSVSTPGAKVSGATEKITVGGTTFACQKVTVKSQGNDVLVLMSNDFPFIVVKLEVQTPASNTVMKAVDFKVIK